MSPTTTTPLYEPGTQVLIKKKNHTNKNNIYVNLSSHLAQLNTRIAASLFTLQTQTNSLAAVVLQNRGGLDMLTAQRGICATL